MANNDPDDTARALRAAPWPEASELADLLSIRNDLVFVQNCCRVAHATLAKEESGVNQTVVRGLWNAALVAYARTFGTGKRNARLTVEDVRGVAADGDTGVVGIHRFVMNTRDKYVAHSVNGFESCQVGVVADADGRNAEIAWGYMHYTSPERDGVETLGVLAARLTVVVESRIEPLRDKCEEKLAGLSSDEILTLPLATFEIASSRNSHVPR